MKIKRFSSLRSFSSFSQALCLMQLWCLGENLEAQYRTLTAMLVFLPLHLTDYAFYLLVFLNWYFAVATFPHLRWIWSSRLQVTEGKNGAHKMWLQENFRSFLWFVKKYIVPFLLASEYWTFQNKVVDLVTCYPSLQ